MKTNRITYSLEEIPVLVEMHLIPLLESYTIFTFEGFLGAGKTTLIKELLAHLGVKEDVVSPTFTYLNTYKGSENRVFHHFDLYRLERPELFIQAGFDEYLHQDSSWCLIEWPKVITELLADTSFKKRVCALQIYYDPDDKEKRILQIGGGAAFFAEKS